jgi:hypothetical protein
MNNNYIKTILTASVIVLLGVIAATYFITKSTIKPQEKTKFIKIDTVTIKADTIYKDRPYAVMISGKVDTIVINDTVKSIVARADTIISKDSSYIRVAYYFPPENRFDVEMNLKEKIVTITRDMKEYVPVDRPWYDRYWVGATSALGVVLGIVLIAK